MQASLACECGKPAVYEIRDGIGECEDCIRKKVRKEDDVAFAKAFGAGMGTFLVVWVTGSQPVIATFLPLVAGVLAALAVGWWIWSGRRRRTDHLNRWR